MQAELCTYTEISGCRVGERETERERERERERIERETEREGERSWNFRSLRRSVSRSIGRSVGRSVVCRRRRYYNKQHALPKPNNLEIMPTANLYEVNDKKGCKARRGLQDLRREDVNGGFVINTLAISRFFYFSPQSSNSVSTAPASGTASSPQHTTSAKRALLLLAPLGPQEVQARRRKMHAGG